MKLPKGIDKTGYGIFEDCASLKKVTLEDGTTKLPDRIFSGCESLESVILPDTITYAGAKALDGCNAVLYCNTDSETAITLIDREIPFKNIGSIKQTANNRAVDKNTSYYEQNSASGVLSYIVKYNIKNNKKDSCTQRKLLVHIPDCANLIDGTVTLDGVYVKNYSYTHASITDQKDYMLSVPVTEDSGVLKFSLNPSGDGNMASYARLGYIEEGVYKEDTIGIINGEQGTITLLSDSYTCTGKISVSGAAPAGKTVTLSVQSGKDETVETAKVEASKSGTYKTVVEIKAPVENTAYQLTASADTDGGKTITAETEVVYRKNVPVLEELAMYYQDHVNNYKYVLSDETMAMKYITFYPAAGYSFTASFSNPEEIDRVFVVSTHNNVRKYLPAFWDAKKQCFVASGQFEPGNDNYVPGRITVEYTLKKDRKTVSAESAFDYASDAVMADITQAWKQGNVAFSEKQGTRELNMSFGKDMGDISGISLKLTETEKKNTQSLSEFLAGKENVVTTSKNEKGKLYGFRMDHSNAGTYVISVYDVSGEKEYSYTLETENNKKHYSLEKILEQAVEAGMEDDYLSELLPLKASYEEIKGRIYARGLSEEEQEKALLANEKLHILSLVMKVLTGMFGISDIAPEKGMDDPNGLFVMGMFALGELYDYLDELAVLDVNEGGTGYNIRWIIDPSGYVYEAVTGNRLENVKATVYYKDSETGEAVLWNAEEYDQINPQFTGKDGVYAWDVPAGLWQVIYELEGYETVKSEWMEVPPPQTEVNIAMVSKQAPEAESIHIYEEYAEISFTQYMQPDTINNIIITDSDGKRIAYTAEYSKEETAADGTVYAKNFRLVFASKLTPDAKKYTLSVPETVKNYAGKDVIKTSVEKGCVLKPTLQASTAAAISHGTTDYLDILIENYTGEEQLECTSSFDEIISVGEVTIGKDGKAKAAVTANMPGEADITIKLKGTTEQVVIRVSVDALTEYIAGDLNEDGKMDSSDALFVLKIAAKLITPTGKQQKAGDVNQDGSVNSTDALMISKYAAGLIETF